MLHFDSDTNLTTLKGVPNKEVILKTGIITRIVLIIITIYSGVVYAQIQNKTTINNLTFQTQTPLRSVYVGFPFQQKIAVTGGTPPYVYELFNQKLPEGIHLSEDGYLRGTPQTIDAATFTVNVSDYEGQTAQETFSIDFVEQLMIQTSSLDNAIAGNVYRQQLLAIGGSTGEYKWKLVSNNMPDGMQLDPITGVFSGTPQKSGKWILTFVVQDTDSHTSTQSIPFRIIEPLKITSLVLPTGIIGEEYSEMIQISGGVGPYTFGCNCDYLPDNLSFDPVTGIIEGVADSSIPLYINVSVQDYFISTPQYVQEKIELRFNRNFKFITNSVLPDALENVPLSDNFLISVVGGIDPYTFEIIDGALPYGVDLNIYSIDVALIRMPREAGNFTFTLQATDAEGAIARKTFFWRIINVGRTVNIKHLSTSMNNNHFSSDIQAENISGTVLLNSISNPMQNNTSKTQKISKNSGKNFDTINDKRKIFGIVTQCDSNILITNATIASEYEIIKTSTNCLGEFEIRDLSSGMYKLIFSRNNYLNQVVDVFLESNYDYYINICMCPDMEINFSTETILPSAIIGKQYGKTIDVIGGCLPYKFSCEGNLPNNLTLAPDTGLISGTINHLENSNIHSFTITVSDQNDMIKKKQYSINIYHDLQFSSSSFESCIVGSPFTKTINTIGGKQPYFYEIYSGELPDGIIFKETGVMEGIPENVGETCITIQVTDDEGRSIRQNHILEIVNELQIITDRLDHAIVGNTYNMKLEASGGSYNNYQWETASVVPVNMKMDKNSGVFSGIPMQAEQLPISFKVIDSCGHIAVKTLLFQSVNQLQINSRELAPGYTGVYYSEYILVSGGMQPYKFTLSNNLPPGLSYDPVFGKISGVPTFDGAIYINVSVQDNCYPNPQIDIERILLTIDREFIFNTTSVLPDALCYIPLNEINDYIISVSGGQGPYTFEIIEGELPEGVYMITGHALELYRTPHESGDFEFTIQATDATGKMIQKTFYWHIVPEMIIVTDTLPVAELNKPYSAILLAKFGTPPYFWDIAEGKLPDGLTLRQENDVWEIYGIPTELSDYIEITFLVYDSHYECPYFKYITLYLNTIDNKDKSFIHHNQPYENIEDIFDNNQLLNSEPILDTLFFLSPGSLESIVIDHHYQKQIMVSGGNSPYTFAILSGNLPSGIILMDNGLLEGEPERTGQTSFVFKVTDTEGQTVEKNFSIEVVDNLFIVNKDFSNALIGYFYKTRLNVTGGLQSQYLWEITSNNMPKGMSLDKFSGEFYGIPKEAKKSIISVKVRDSDGHHAEKSFLFHVIDQLKIEKTILQSRHLGVDYNETIRVSGGIPPYTFKCIDDLPMDLNIDASTGIIHGKALLPGRMDIKIQVMDSFFPVPQILEEILTITINEDFLISTNNVLPTAIQNVPLDNTGQYSIHVVGGAGPYTFTIIDGTLPNGVQLHTENTAEFVQTPTEAGNFEFTLQVTDSHNETTQKEFFWHIMEPVNISTIESIYAIQNKPFYQNLEIFGGISPYTCAIQSGKLPIGLELIKQNNIWTISGIPTELARNAQLIVVIKDSQSIPSSKEIKITFNVIENKLAIFPESLAEAKIEKAYRVKIEALFGKPPYQWNIQSNQLPDGLEWLIQDQCIWIQGKPKVAGSFPVNIQLNDSDLHSEPVSKSLSIVIHDEISIVTENFPKAVYGEFYSQSIEINNDDNTVTCELTEGRLPEGLELNSDICNISGMIDQNATSQTFCIRANSQKGFMSFDEKCFSIIANISDIKIITSFMRKNEQYRYYYHALKSSGGIEPYHWFINKACLPRGLDYYEENNLLYFTGSADQCGIFEFDVQIHDSAQIADYDSKHYQLEIVCSDIVDTTPPTAPQIALSYPDLNNWDDDGIIHVKLQPGEDNDSGISGYSYEWNLEQTTIVDNTIETDSTIIESQILTYGENHYFHVASVDKAGNVSETIHYGPFKVRANMPGDVDGDNHICLKDAIIALKTVSQLMTLNDESQASENVQQDNTIGLADVMRILNELCQTQQP